MKPLVSVIVPNANGAAHLTERIETILAQTYKNLELILMDDCSTDGSQQILNEYETRDRVARIDLREEPCGNAQEQWARGIAMAKGDYIWIAPSSGSSDRKFLEKLVKRITSQNGAVMAFCRSMVIDCNGNETGVCIQQKKMKSKFTDSGYDFISKRFTKANCIADAGAVIFKRDAALRMDSQYTTYSEFGDWFFWAQLAEKGRVTFLPKPYNKYREDCTVPTAALPSTEQGIREQIKLFEYFFSKGNISSGKLAKARVNSIYRIKYVLSFEPQVRKALLTDVGATLWLSIRAFFKKIFTFHKA